MKPDQKRTVVSAIFFSCAVVLLAILIALTAVVGTLDKQLALTFAGTKIPDELRAEGEALASQIEEEGIVMVRNEDKTLPLLESDVEKKGEYRVNVFGWAAIDWITGGSGSGRTVNPDGTTATSANLSPADDLLSALNGYDVFGSGISYNTELVNAYKSFRKSRAAASTDTLHSHDYESCVLYEPTFDRFYTDTLKQNAQLYSDVALVVLGRIAGESNDAPKAQYKINSEGSATDPSRTYLEVSEEEEDLLEYVGTNFKKVVVIVNSTNTMNLGFLNEIDGLDACLIVGGTGMTAAEAIPNVLFGKKKTLTVTTDNDGAEHTETALVDVSPSGRTTDTYVYDFSTNANYAYSGMDGVSQYTGTDDALYPLTVTNPNVGTDDKYPGVSYLDYAEGIYVGYKWYETADAENFWTSDFAERQWGVNSYGDVVQYPFGFGLSYTDFDWKVRSWTADSEKITVTVEVTNSGKYAGQDVIQLYYTPYYDAANGVEMSAVNLCAFAKTKVLEPDEEEIVTMTVYLQDMASYDRNEDGGAYVLEQGDYVLSLRTDSHSLKKNVEGLYDTFITFTHEVTQKIVYKTYRGTNGRNEIENLFTGGGSDGIAVDGSDTESGIETVWLSRKNFNETFPTEKARPRAYNTRLTPTNLYTGSSADAWDRTWSEKYGMKYDQGVKNGLRLYKDGAFTELAYELGNPDNYGSSSWDDVLDQLTYSEMRNLVLHGYIHEEALPSVGKPVTISVDGPAQIGSFNSENPGVGYPMPAVLAQCWNGELAKSFGFAVGKETVGSGRDGWYAPGANLHRSAFGGRNYEYYSEDSFLTGTLCAATVRGALDAGAYTYTKHLVGYDQESYRDGLYCWMTEQTLRETYLRPFKMAIDGGATGLMTSYGRLGAVWTGGSESLLTDLLRNEWGFKGAVLTDYSDHRQYMNADQMLRAGGDLWMDGWGNPGKFTANTSSDAFKANLRSAAKHVLYMWTNAAYEAQRYDGDGETIFRPSGGVFRWWRLAAAGADAVCAAGACTFVVFGVKGLKKKKLKKETAEE